jgi:plastocyanin
MAKTDKMIIGGIVAIVLIIAAAIGFLLLSAQKGDDAAQTGMRGASATGTPAVVITRTEDGYSPSEVTIKKGDIVLWKNESKEYHWPASDIHPTHGIYPEFDPLRPIGPGEDWAFKFDRVGVWKFHDHIRANVTGTITVLDQ